MFFRCTGSMQRERRFCASSFSVRRFWRSSVDCRPVWLAWRRAHYWARELRALGHEVRLMPAQYVKAYVKRNKNDAADAAAICEAVVRPTMRFVAVKTVEQQAAVLLHRGRERLVRQRTGLVNALRGHLAEFGIIAPQGLRHVGRLTAIVRDEGDARLPDLARQVLQVLAAQIEQLEAAVAAIEKQLMAWHKSNPVSQRLATIPGIGPIIATAIAATVTEPSGFRSGREFAAWLGLVPRQNSTGGKVRLGGISKRGNRYLRRLLINGASANLLRSKATKADPWVIGIRRRRPPLVVAVALGRNVTFEWRWAIGDYGRLPALAAHLARHTPSVIASALLPAARAAKAATATIPIVFISGSDPTETGLVTRLNRPTENVTGVSLFAVPLIAKRLELLHELIPGVPVVHVLVNPSNPNFRSNMRGTAESGQ